MHNLGNLNNIQLTSGEIGSLWHSYVQHSLGQCMLQSFSQHVEDTDIAPLVQHTLQGLQQHVNQLENVFIQENMPVPKGFTTEDVNNEAPRLFSDSFMLYYIQNMANYGLTLSSMSLRTSARTDAEQMFTERLHFFADVHLQANQLLKEKGLYIRSPYAPSPNKVTFIERQNFLQGILGSKRELLFQESTQFFTNIQTNLIGRSLTIGFSQVANSSEVRQYMIRGKQIASKHIEVFGTYLTESDLPTPMTADAEVTDSTSAPFSDRLMLYHIVALNNAGISNYGASMSMSMRTDIFGNYHRLITEIAQYIEDGINFMIDNGWMEQPPQHVNRNQLAQGNGEKS